MAFFECRDHATTLIAALFRIDLKLRASNSPTRIAPRKSINDYFKELYFLLFFYPFSR